MVIEIRVEILDWQIFIYDTTDVINKYESFREVLNLYGYDYNQILSHWKNKKHIKTDKTNSFILIDDANRIYAIKFARHLFIDIGYPYESLDPKRFSFLTNIKNILDITRRDEKIKAIFNI